MRKNFPEKIKKAARKRADGKCEGCGEPTGAHNPAEVDHAKEDWEGGKPALDNAVVLGRKCCHRKKSAAATARRAKADRMKKSHLGQKPKSKLAAPPRERRPVLAIDGDAKADRLRAKHEEHLRKRQVR